MAWGTLCRCFRTDMQNGNENDLKSAEIASKNVRKRQMRPRMQSSPVGDENAQSVLDDGNALALMGTTHTYRKACQPKSWRKDRLWVSC